MTIPIGRQTLLLHADKPSAALRPGEVWNLTQRFGPLARWWLKDGGLSRAAERARRLSNDEEAQFLTGVTELSAGPGACWVLFANQDERVVHLRPAFLMPLQWFAGRPHSVRLWDNLRSLAGQVVDQLATQDPAACGWGLQLSEQVEPSLAECDVSGLDFACQSGWAALFVGLYLALGAGRPHADVFASVAWEANQSLQAVDGVADKLDLAGVRQSRAFLLPDFPQVRQQVSQWQARRGLTAP